MEERGPAPSIGPAPEQAAAAGPQVLRPLPVEDDLGLDADFERLAAAVEAGRLRVPQEWELEGPAVSVSLGDASDLDPALLAAMCGPNGLGGESLSPMFGQDKAADVLRPGPVLSALTEQAVADLAALADDQLAGALSAARRLESRAAYLQTLAIAEFARRREAEREAAKARKIPLHCRPGQFPGEELAAELVSTPHYADERIWEATDLTTRLPRTLTGMAAGTIDATRAHLIWSYTWSLSPQDAARADEILAAAAPGLRPDQLGYKAAALEMKLDPEAVRQRKERARRDSQRVEVKHERSGNAMLAGRELDPVTALAAKANIDALAARLRGTGREGSLQQLRAWIMTELLQGRNPLDHLTPTEGHSETASGSPAGGPANSASEEWPDDPGYRDEDDCADGREADPVCDSTAVAGGTAKETPAGSLSRARPSPGTPADGVTPLPALINVLVPAGTLLGWSTAPSQVGSWGWLDAGETQAFVRAASRNPRTRFCMTLIAPDGTALAHGCSRGQHVLTPESPATSRSGSPRGAESPLVCPVGSRGDPPPANGPDPEQAQRLADLIRRLSITFRPIAQGRCDHGDAEDQYAPSKGLKHLIRARSATCTAPACNAQAIYCDLDHTLAYPDGTTCQCNLAPKCRRHHRCKQASGWKVEQQEPGVLRWTVPSGRSYTTAPSVYDL